MNDLVTQELNEKIILDLLTGVNPDTMVIKYSCGHSDIMRIMAGNVFSERVREYLEKDILISGLAAVKNIKTIAGQEGISKATQLKANQWLAEKALDLSRIGLNAESPATMTQDQLARRLKELQSEAIKRAKPIDTGVIEGMTSNPLEDMLG